MKTITAIYDRLIACLAIVAGLLTAGMALWVTYDVMARYLLRRPTIWAVDLSEYALVWVTFLAAPWVLRQQGHVRIEILVERLPLPLQRQLGVGTSVVGAIACAVMAWQGAIATWDSYARGLTMAKAWEVPQFLVYVIIPIGSILLAVEFVRHVGRHIRRRDVTAIVDERAPERPAI